MQGGGGPAEPVPYLVPGDLTTRKPYCHAELDSASIQHCVLSVTLARFRNKFGMTVNVQCDRKNELSSRGANESERRGDPVKNVSSSSGLPRSRWSLAMTPTESVLSLVNRLSVKKCAFTMAEILLSLTIIGVVAAITLPSLTGNINERTWNTQRKALYARFSQAIALMPALNGYGTLTEGDSSTSAVDTAAETFVTAGLSKVLKINNICDSEHLEDCGITSKLTTLNGSIISTPTKMSELNPKMIDNSYSGSAWGHSQLDTLAVAFETANGESILAFYNPNCQALMGETTAYPVQPKVCANFIFDMNSNKGPNTVGKDIGFMTVLYSTDSAVVAPNVPVQKAASRSATQQEAISICKGQDPEYRIPSQDELASMFVNQLLITGAVATTFTDYWSSIIYNSTTGWTQGFATGLRALHGRNEKLTVHCVKR